VREQTLQKKIIDWLNKQPDIWAVKVMCANRNGTPDIIASVGGRFVGIEVKAPGKLGSVSPLQRYQIDSIELTGAVAFPADSLDTVKDAVGLLLD